MKKKRRPAINISFIMLSIWLDRLIITILAMIFATTIFLCTKSFHRFGCLPHMHRLKLLLELLTSYTLCSFVMQEAHTIFPAMASAGDVEKIECMIFYGQTPREVEYRLLSAILTINHFRNFHLCNWVLSIVKLPLNIRTWPSTFFSTHENNIYHDDTIYILFLQSVSNSGGDWHWVDLHCCHVNTRLNFVELRTWVLGATMWLGALS